MIEKNKGLNESEKSFYITFVLIKIHVKSLSFYEFFFNWNFFDFNTFKNFNNFKYLAIDWSIDKLNWGGFR